MRYMTTATGKHFYPMNPNQQDIDLEDIAHALSLICRANGHFRHFYSVAQHSIACAEEAIARGYAWEVILGCLLHDASEAYLSDVTRAVKKELLQYLAAEEALQNAIREHFIGRALTRDERKQVCEIDDLMLSAEFHQLMPEELNEDYKKLLTDVRCEVEKPQKVKERFMQMATLGIEDLYITVYHPTEKVLSVLRKLVSKMGFYIWQTPQILRIKKYEGYMDEAQALLQTGENKERLHYLIGELKAYYESVKWRKDFESDEAELIPKNLKRSVLSEDGIYNLLEEYKEVSE